MFEGRCKEKRKEKKGKEKKRKEKKRKKRYKFSKQHLQLFLESLESQMTTILYK